MMIMCLQERKSPIIQTISRLYGLAHGRPVDREAVVRVALDDGICVIRALEDAVDLAEALRRREGDAVDLGRGHVGQRVVVRRRRPKNSIGRLVAAASGAAASSSSSSPSGMSMRGGPTRGPVAVSGTGAAVLRVGAHKLFVNMQAARGFDGWCAPCADPNGCVVPDGAAQSNKTVAFGGQLCCWQPPVKGATTCTPYNRTALPPA